ncbi:hypothetical protein DFH06DRAFT_1147383 [Mycena polygramma]|nr:hypothetical protein DFH06DRAFT_1147383 [Mycena polygramma]
MERVGSRRWLIGQLSRCSAALTVPRQERRTRGVVMKEMKMGRPLRGVTRKLPVNLFGVPNWSPLMAFGTQVPTEKGMGWSGPVDGPRPLRKHDLFICSGLFYYGLMADYERILKRVPQTSEVAKLADSLRKDEMKRRIDLAQQHPFGFKMSDRHRKPNQSGCAPCTTSESFAYMGAGLGEGVLDSEHKPDEISNVRLSRRVKSKVLPGAPERDESFLLQ